MDELEIDYQGDKQSTSASTSPICLDVLNNLSSDAHGRLALQRRPSSVLITLPGNDKVQITS